MKRMMDQEINEITKGLKKLYILQVIIERAFQRIITTNVNAKDYFNIKEVKESIAEINYRGF